MTKKKATVRETSNVGDLLWTYAEDYAKVQQLEADLKERKSLLTEKARLVDEQLRFLGSRRVTLEDGRSIFRRVDTYFSVLSAKKEEAVKVFEADETTQHLVKRDPTISSSSLSKWCREEEANGGLPDRVLNVINRKEVPRVMVSRAGMTEEEFSVPDSENPF